MMKNSRLSVVSCLLGILLPFSALAAGFFGQGLENHSHSGPADGGQTLTNTQLNNPTINSPTWQGPQTLTDPTFNGTVAGGATYTSPTLTDANVQIKNYTTAGLPSAPPAGRLAVLTDGIRGAYVYYSSRWFSLTHDFVNVKWFGASGTDTSSDVAAIQASINAVSSNGVVFLPTEPTAATVYTIDAALIVKSNVVIQCAGQYAVTLSFPQSNLATPNFSLFENAAELSNFAVRDCGLRGNRAYQTTNYVSGSADGYAVFFGAGPISNVSFERNYIREFGAMGAALNSGGGGIVIVPTGTDTTCVNVSVLNNHFLNNNKIPGFYIDCQNGSVSGGGGNWRFAYNYVVTGPSGENANNNATYFLCGYGAASAKACTNVSADHNQYHYKANSDSVFEANGARNCSFTHNDIFFSSTGIANTALIRSDVQGCDISHNRVRSENADTTKPVIAVQAFSNGEFQDDVCICWNELFIDNSSTPVIKVLKGSRRVSVKGNKLRGRATALANALQIGEASDVTVEGNEFENCLTCVQLATGTSPVPARIGIVRNRFTDVGGSGVAVIGTTGGPFSITQLLIDGNLLYSPKSTAGGASFASVQASASTDNYLGVNRIFGGLAVIGSGTASSWASYQEIGVGADEPVRHVTASGDVQAKGKVKGNSVSLADSATQDLTENNTGLLVITNNTDKSICLYELRDGFGPVEISDPEALCTPTAANAGTVNVFWNGGTSSYRIENKRGASRTIEYTVLH